MKISLAPSGVIRKLGTEKAFRVLKEAGFDACDYPITLYADSRYAKEGIGESLFDLPEEEYIRVFDEVATMARKAGMEIAQTHAPYPSNTRDEDVIIITPRNLRLSRLSIRMTSRLECPYVVIHPAFCHNINLDLNPEARARCKAENMAYYSALIPDLRTYGVRCCLENMYGRDSETRELCPTACSHAAEMCEWIDELNAIAGEELFCACLDIGHCLITGDDPAAEIRTLGHRLQRVHLHDARPGWDGHTIPYLGEVDWVSVAAALRDIGYAGPLNFEADSWPRPFPTELQEAAVQMSGAAAKHFRSLVCGRGE